MRFAILAAFVLLAASLVADASRNVPQSPPANAPQVCPVADAKGFRILGYFMIALGAFACHWLTAASLQALAAFNQWSKMRRSLASSASSPVRIQLPMHESVTM